MKTNYYQLQITNYCGKHDDPGDSLDQKHQVKFVKEPDLLYSTDTSSDKSYSVLLLSENRITRVPFLSNSGFQIPV